MSRNRTAIQQRAQREMPYIDQYATDRLTPAEMAQVPGLYHNTLNFGSYMPDNEAMEKTRDFYETLDAVAVASEGTKDSVMRTAPVSEREIDLIRASKEATLKMKNDQYWTSQINPALPWTLTEVTKVRPDILEKRLNAIKQLSQYTLDYEILKHLGHGGDPRLAELQYMIDQGQMSHMPVSTIVAAGAEKFRKGNFSIWNAFNPGSDSSDYANSKFSDKELFMARSAFAKPGRDFQTRARITTAGRSLGETFKDIGRPVPELDRP